ncbi:MAG: amino acid adenylation domain-containing protein, partial [Acidimicrobiia bacterium]|nr:amino acid adenylation domain-containing protein [Acidimicrobiia bacterium]
ELVEVGLEYAGTVFDADAAARFLDLFADTLVRGWAEPDLTPAQLVPGSPRVGPPIGRADRIPDLVDDQPTAAEAVRSGAEARSYGELRRRRDQIAERLHALSVGRGDRVALLVGRSTDAVAAALAIWHVGASYVPIDASQPAARIERLLGDAAPALVITDRAHHAVLAPVCLDLADVDDVDPSRVEPVQGDEAYVIFTSGSTGEPKGVVVSHANLATSTAARASFYAAPPERFVMVSSLAFDSSMVGLWWTLSTGGEVVLPTDDEVHDVDQLGALFERAAPSHTLMVPTLYGALLDRAGHRLAALDTVIVAGEACPTDLVTRHHRQLRAELVNEYGPSEATVWATAHRCRNDEGLVPIGGPIAGVTLMVADERGRPVPDGVTGELWIGGPTVAGYLHGDDPAFAERHGGRWYRTGDRVRARPGVDELVFLGRVDDQLSLGGRRVEPAEIEQALTSVHGVHHAVVGLVASAIDDPMRQLAQRSPADAAAILREAASAADPIAVLGRLAGSRPVLVAHVETAPGVDGERIRRAARELLPDPLVPRHVRVVDALPRTANGKIDRDAVELSVATSSASAPSPPAVDEGARREMLAAWRKVFGDDTIDAHSDFFELGGDSLLAVGLAAELEAQLGRRVPINLLIEARTPSALAAALGPGPNPDGLLVPLRRAGMATPLVVVSPGGGNLLTYEKLISRLDPDVPVWGLRLPGAEGREAPATSMDELVDRFGAELRGQFAHRPLRLLGYSTGGLVAYELATRWRDEGADIEQLVLVDTVFPGRLRDVHAALRREWQDKLVWYDASAVAGVVYDGVRRRVQPRLADVLRRRAARRGRSAPAWANELHMHEVAAQIAETYRPGPYGGPTLLIRASQTDPALTETPWVELLDDVRVEVVPGRHYGDEELLTSDSVDDVAGALDRLS